MNAEQVGLTLQSLRDDDRNWLLGQLSQTERELIDDLVKEQLRHPNAPESKFEQAIGKVTSLECDGLPISQLNRLASTQIAAVLDSEPDWVAAVILNAHAWTWHTAVLEELGIVRKAAIRRCAHAITEAHPMRGVLLQQLLNHARAVPTPHLHLSDASVIATKPPVSPWRKPFQRVKKWLP